MISLHIHEYAAHYHVFVFVVPKSVVNLIAARVSDVTISLSWATASESQQDGFEVAHRTPGNDWVAAEEISEMTKEINGLNPGCIYEFSVRPLSRNLDDTVYGDSETTAMSTCMYGICWFTIIQGCIYLSHICIYVFIIFLIFIFIHGINRNY